MPSLPRHAARFAPAAIVAIAALGGPMLTGAKPAFTPARYLSGSLPAAPALAVAGGEVFLEVHIAADGGVESIRTLRATPPFTGAVIDAVRGWRFTAATEVADPSADQAAAAVKSVASQVLVAAVFAAPALNGPTQGTPPHDVLRASDEIPLPDRATPASYPLRAMGGGTVLVDVTLDATGAPTDARVSVSSPGFDASALAAARSWSFRAARRNGTGSPAHAYLLFGFRPPVVGH